MNEDTKMFLLALLMLILFFAYFYGIAWLQHKISTPGMIPLSPKNIKVLVKGRGENRTIILYYIQRGSSLLESKELNFDCCEINLSAEYNSCPYMKISTGEGNEKRAKLCLPENTEIHYD